MPWANFNAPSSALGALAAVLRRDLQRWTVSCHWESVSVWGQLAEVYEEIARDDKLGEFIYGVHLFPERRWALREHFLGWAAEQNLPADHPTLFDRTMELTGSHLDELAERVAGKADVVGFTTSYCQLFASIAAARRIKALVPELRVILGGPVLQGEVGRSIAREFSEIDLVVQGEGERYLPALLGAMESSEQQDWGASFLPLATGVLQRTPGGEIVGQVGWPVINDLERLPYPDFDDWAELAKSKRIYWQVPVESSRGCWWSLAASKEGVSKGCAFCALASGGYREKSSERTVREMDYLAERYLNPRLRFVDNTLRQRGLQSHIRQIGSSPMKVRFFQELRAQLSPTEFLALREAGCETVQIGIEALSTASLKRMGKGTTAIQNLQAMRSCYELGIYCGANLMMGFPGTTQDEVDESAYNATHFGSLYQPPSLVTFQLYRNSLVARHPARYSIANLRNDESFLVALPTEAWQRLDLHWLDYDDLNPALDWNPLVSAVERWWDLHERLTFEDGSLWFLGDKPLDYIDAGTFLEVRDRRAGGLNVHTLEEPWRELYLFCMQIRHRERITANFAGRCSAPNVLDALQALVEIGLVFSEDERYLSLAVADRPEVAAERIRSLEPGTGQA